MKKHSPEILTGIGIAGMIATTVSAVRATPKALQLIDAREIKENRRLSNKEIVATTWKCYVPAAVTGVLSTACLVGASSANLRRNTALATAYSISETALKEYKEKAVEVVGEKKEQAIRDAVAKETLTKHPLGEREVIITGGGDILCFDPLTNRYFKSDRDRLMRAMNELNKRMRDEMRVSLNDFYDEIGLSEAEVGEHLGWDIDNGKGYIDLDFSTQLADALPCRRSQPPAYLPLVSADFASPIMENQTTKNTFEKENFTMEDKRMNEIEEIEATEVDETQDSSNAGALLAGVIGGFIAYAVIGGAKKLRVIIEEKVAAKKLAEAAKTDKAEIDSVDEDSEEN